MFLFGFICGCWVFYLFVINRKITNKEIRNYYAEYFIWLENFYYV